MKIDYEVRTPKQIERDVFSEAKRREEIFHKTISILNFLLIISFCVTLTLCITGDFFIYFKYVCDSILGLTFVNIINLAFSFEHDHIFTSVFHTYLSSIKISERMIPIVPENRFDSMIFHKYMYESFYKFNYFKALLLKKKIYVAIDDNIIAGYLAELYRHHFELDLNEFTKQYDVTRIELVLLKFFFMNSFNEYLNSEEVKDNDSITNCGVYIRNGSVIEVKLIGHKYFRDVIDMTMSDIPRWFYDVKHLDSTLMPVNDKAYKRA
ncbi:MAG: hypothetical protein MJ245_02500 [Clostridia bacterium]|nr:hypothetical protein [Clostridia bacterium]